jgi:hypothetical protein
MEDLEFREPAVDVPTRFRSFEGANLYNMPLLLSGKDESGNIIDVPRLPMTPKQLLYERVHGSNEHDRNLLRDNYVYTACAVIGDPQGSGEVVVGLYNDPVVRELVNSLNPNSVLQRGSLPVDADHYHAIRKNGFVISSNTANRLRHNKYNKKKVREAFWDYVAEGDARLVMDNLALVQEKNGGDMKNSMGLWLYSNPGLGLLCVGSVGSLSSLAIGGRNLDNDGGRLIGVAPEAPIAHEKSTDSNLVQPSLEQILYIVNDPDLNREGMVKAVSRLYKK